MFRSHTNGELSLKNLNEEVTLSGWVQTIRDKGKSDRSHGVL